MEFSHALLLIKSGRHLTRKGWNGKGMWVEMQVPDENSKMTRPYLYLCIPKDSSSQFGEEAKEIDRVPWTVSQTDLMIDDWEICT